MTHLDPRAPSERAAEAPAPPVDAITVDLLAELAAIRSLLGGLSHAEPEAVHAALDAAHAAGSAEEPERAAVAEAVGRAVGISRQAEGWGEAAPELRPRLWAVAAWLQHYAAPVLEHIPTL
jgi:hypothetical protein